MSGYLQPLAAIVVMTAAVSAAPAYAQQWQGAWDTNYGQLRLVQDGDHVFGDYGGGTIEGIYDASSGVLRAVFRNPDGATGYAEFQMQSGFRAFVGTWNWASSPLPDRRNIPAERRWTGQRTATTVPPIVNFRLPADRSRLLSSAPAKYRDWVNGFNRLAASAMTSSQSTPSTAGTAAAQQVNPLARKFPKLRDYPADFVPTAIQIDLREVGFLFNFPNLLSEGQGRAADIYGTYGVYAYCETASGSRALPPMGGQPNRMFDKPRSNPVRVGVYPGSTVLDSNQGVRKFALDQQCMNTPGARFAIQIQMNLNERQAIPAQDRKFGYRSFKFYLDQLPHAGESRYRTATTSQGTVLFNNESRPEFLTHSYLAFVAANGKTVRVDLDGRLIFVR